MPIIIPKKSNKTQTPGINSLGKTNSHSKGPIKPFIDKISLVVTPVDDQDASEIHSAIWAQFEDNAVFQNAGNKPKTGGYNVVKLISLPGMPHRPYFSYKHAGGKAEKIRIEFNPRKIGGIGLMNLHSVLSSIVPGGWGYFVHYSRITRIDVAVNIPDIRMDEFLFMPQQGKSAMKWGVDGHLQSFRLGLPKGNQTLVYSVKQKRLAKGQVWAGKSVVRVERRLRNPPTKKLTDLEDLKNPFASMVLTEVMPPPPKSEKPWQWSMFEDSVHVRGLAQALALLPEDRRTKYRAHLKTHAKPWWHPDDIWLHWKSAYTPLLAHSS